MKNNSADVPKCSNVLERETSVYNHILNKISMTGIRYPSPTCPTQVASDPCHATPGQKVNLIGDLVSVLFQLVAFMPQFGSRIVAPSGARRRSAGARAPSWLNTDCMGQHPSTLEANLVVLIYRLNRDAPQIAGGRREAQGLGPQLGGAPLPAPDQTQLRAAATTAEQFRHHTDRPADIVPPPPAPATAAAQPPAPPPTGIVFVDLLLLKGLQSCHGRTISPPSQQRGPEVLEHRLPEGESYRAFGKGIWRGPRRRTTWSRRRSTEVQRHWTYDGQALHTLHWVSFLKLVL
ncbi:hypothetical protein TNIN_189231 [Trichonephila inaurata madagascariensis]|uniref:Uncharacterized protein n=1 Tax=Trichonephila inaurata madagascariensis TaxID=2747483 RepID=A0A8X6WNT3_9ARAC|nr:hypothetical protein TNIN_189231 [Trichonephila inaurata madagascariensis]